MKVAFWRAVGEDTRWAGLPSLAERCLQAYAQRHVTGIEWEHCTSAQDLYESDADVAAISAVTDVWGQALEVMDVAREIGKTVVVGGPHITAMPLSPCAARWKVVGEGEIAFCEVLRGIQEGLTPTPVFAGAPLDLETVPWMPMGLQTGPLSVGAVVSRGCAYRCSFCSASRAWGRVRSFAPKAIGDWCARTVPQGGGLSFHDLNFSLDLEWMRQTTDAMVGAGAGSDWRVRNISSRTNLITQELHDVVAPMVPASIGVGMESASPEILSRLKPGCTVEDHERASALAYENEVELRAMFIIGTPGETDADLQRTYDFIRRWQGKYFTRAGIYALTPYPGTVWWDYALERGLIGDAVDWSTFRCAIGGSDRTWDGVLYLNEETMPRDRAVDWSRRITELCRTRDPENVKPRGLVHR